MVNNLQKIGGVAAIGGNPRVKLGFVFFGAFWDFPVEADSVRKLAFLADNQVNLSIINLIMYVLFGIILVVLVVALHDRLKGNTPTLSQIASVFAVTRCLAQRYGSEDQHLKHDSNEFRIWSIWGKVPDYSN